MTLSVTYGISLRMLLTVNKVWGKLWCCCQGSGKSSVRSGIWRWILKPVCLTDCSGVVISVTGSKARIVTKRKRARLQAWWAIFSEEPSGGFVRGWYVLVKIIQWGRKGVQLNLCCMEKQAVFNTETTSQLTISWSIDNRLILYSLCVLCLIHPPSTPTDFMWYKHAVTFELEKHC